MCKVVLKAHILTGCDVTSTNIPVNLANLDRYMFCDDQQLLDKVAKKAEQIL